MRKTNLIQSEMRKFLVRLGYKTRYDGSTGNLTAELDGKEVCAVQKDCLMFSSESSGNSHQEIIDEYHKIGDYVNAYENAPLLGAGVDMYRKLCKFNDFVLAAKVMQDNSFEFVVWSYTFDRKNVCNGSYTYDYDAAKEKFAVRSGLMRESFSDDELKLIRNSLKFSRKNAEMDFKQIKAIESIIEQIEERVPTLAEQVQDEGVTVFIG